MLNPFVMFSGPFDDQHTFRTNRTYSACLLWWGWIAAVFAMLSVFYIFALPTSSTAGINLSAFTSLTPTPSAESNTTLEWNTTTTDNITLTSESSEVVEESGFKIAGAALITLGVGAPFVSWVAIYVERERHKRDVCPRDKFGFSILALGAAAGAAFISGVMFASHAETRGRAAIGWSVLLTTAFILVIVALLSRHRHFHHFESDEFEMT